MADLSITPHITHVAHVKPIVHSVIQGYSMLTILISNTVSAAVAGGLAWYVRGRGMTGVQIDINNIKAELSSLGAKVEAAKAA